MTTRRSTIPVLFAALLVASVGIVSRIGGGSDAEPSVRLEEPNVRRALSPNEFEERFHRASSEWKDALKEYVFQRQYPLDSIPEGAYQRAASHRDRLPDAPIGSTSGALAPNGAWEFIGPRDLDAPYRRYFGPSPVSGRVSAVAYDPNNASTYYIGSGFGGLMRTTNGGQTWSTLSDDWDLLHTSSIAVDPGNSQNLYVGTGDYQTTSSGSGLGYGIGVMKSTDAGSTFRNVGRTQMLGEAVSSLVVHPDASNVLIATTGRGRSAPGRVWISQDFGESWTPMAVAGVTQSNDFSSCSISLPRTSGARNIYTIGGRPGTLACALYRSRDQGATWSSIALPTDVTGNPYVVASQTSADRVYVLDSRVGGGVWRSDNAGANWTNITGDFPTGPGWVNGSDYSLGTRVISNGRVYLCVSASGSGSNAPTGGATNNTWWQWITDSPGFSQTSYNFVLGCLRAVIAGAPRDVLLLGQVDVFLCSNPTDVSPNWISAGRTTEAGTNANTGSPALTHSDQHAFALNPSNPFQALIGNDGGVYRATYSTLTNSLNFTNLNLELAFTQFYDASWHPNQADRVIGAAQDNAFPNSIAFARPGDLSKWQNVGLGDGIAAEVNPNNPNVQYISNQYGSIYLTNDNWSSWNRDTFPGKIRSGGSGSTFREPIFYHASTNNLYHANSAWIDRYDSASGAWTNFLAQTRDVKLWQVISFAANDSSRIYAGSLTGQLAVSTDSGNSFSSWDDQVVPLKSLPNRTITDIDVHPNNSNRFLVAFSGFESAGDSGHLYLTTMTPVNDTFLVTHVDVSGSGATGLPDVPINTVEHDPMNPQNTWYVGTDVGVFMTNDAGVTWYNATRPLGLPNVQVNDLEYIPGTGYLNAATWGRGMWRIRLGGANLIEISVSPDIVKGGHVATGTVTLFDPAPPNQVTTVSLESSRSSSATVPTSVIVPAGERTKTFGIETWGDDSVRDVTIRAKRGIIEKATVLRVQPATIDSIEILPSSVLGGETAVATVRFDGLVHRPFSLGLASSHPDIVGVPDAVQVPEGASQISFPVESSAVATDTTVTVTATFRGLSRNDTLVVRAGKLLAYTLSSSTVTAGSTVRGTVSMSSQAPIGGKVVALTSSHPQLLRHVDVVTILAGESSVSFDIEALGVSTVTPVVLRATSSGVTRETNLTLNPIKLLDFDLLPDRVPGGGAFSGRVTLRDPAPFGGQAVDISSDRPLVDIPGQVIVAAGSTVASFNGTAHPVEADETVQLTVNIGSSSLSKSLFVRVPVLVRITLNPHEVIGGNTVTGTVELDGIAAVDTPVAIKAVPAGYVITPEGLIVPKGASSKSVQFSTIYSDGPRDVTIFAKLKALETSDVVRVRPARVSGKLVFDDLAVSPTLLNPVTIALRNQGTTTLIKELVVDLSVDAAYSFDSPVSGLFDLAVKHQNWLRNLRTVNVGAQDVGGQTVLFANGDVTGDNTVNIVDFLALRQAFGAAPGAPNWNPMSDLNKDGSVGLADFLILRKNFGRTGLS